MYIWKHYPLEVIHTDTYCTFPMICIMQIFLKVTSMREARGLVQEDNVCMYTGLDMESTSAYER